MPNERAAQTPRRHLLHLGRIGRLIFPRVLVGEAGREGFIQHIQ